MSRWSATDIPDLSGKTAVVTGANGGLGRHVTLELARRGATVVLACRSGPRAEDAVEWVTAQAPGATLEQLSLDLASLDAVRAAAAELLRRHPAIDMLVNNAGVIGVDFATTADGHEMHFGVNHLGHFAFSGLVLPALLAVPGSRVVSVSSGMARLGHIDFDDLDWSRHYRRWGAYAASKLANLLFAFELSRRAEARGRSLVSNAAHPGYASTGVQAGAAGTSGLRMGALAASAGNRLLAQPASQGALPILYASTVQAMEGGEYAGPGGWLGMRGAPRKVAPPVQALERQTARRLWNVSAELTGVRYELLDDHG